MKVNITFDRQQCLQSALSLLLIVSLCALFCSWWLGISGYCRCYLERSASARHLSFHITGLQRLIYTHLEFKLAVLICKALNNLSLLYLSDDCQLVATIGRHQLRSSDSFKCTLTCTGSRLGDQAFAAGRPRLWNSLPTHVRRLDLSLDTFRRKLEMYLTVRGTRA